MISESMKSRVAEGSYQFGEFRLDGKNLLLFRAQEIVSLPPKTVEVLLALVVARGQVVTKQEILNKVWADTFVEENNLPHHVSQLRKALGEERNGRKFIETIPRRGYRFVASVNTPAEIESPETQSAECAVTKSVAETIVEPFEFRAAFGDAEIFTPDTEPPAKNLSARNSRRRFLWATAFGVGLVLLAGTFFLARRGMKPLATVARGNAPEMKIRRLTPDADADAPAVAPDGASVVFTKLENGQTTLWRKTIASGEMTQLLPPVQTKDGSIAATRFSPDGRWIYFKRIAADTKNSTVSRVGSNGGAPQKICEKVGSDFSISPDGKQLAFTRDYQFLIIADAESGAERVAATHAGSERFIRSDFSSSVAWSPDGARVIYAISSLENNAYIQQLRELNLATSAESRISIDRDLGNIYQIEWLPDGSELLVSCDETWALPNQLWQIAYPSGKTRRIQNEADNFLAIRLSADGKTLVAHQELGHYNLWTAALDNLERRKQITLGAAAQHGRYGVSFTPQDKIVYTSTESDAVDLWEIDAGGGSQKQLTVNAGKANYFPEITADGRYLVFVSRRSGVNQVWRADADGRHPVQLSQGLESWDFSLSPENEVYYVNYSVAEKRSLLYKISVEGGAVVPVNDYYYQDLPWFSPDGRWMLFYGGATKDEKPRFSLVERATGKIVRYFDKMSKYLHWMPDSKAIIYADTLQTLMRQSVESNSPPQLLADFSPNKIDHFDFSPHAKNIVFALGNVTGEIVLIENFLGDGIK